jgi:hypothetical protein
VPTVYLEASNGLRLPLLSVGELEDDGVELLAATIGALAGEAPAVAAAADDELAATGRAVFNSPELQAVHEVVEWAVTDAGLPIDEHKLFVQEAYGALVEPGRGILFTTLAVEAGGLTGNFHLTLPDEMADTETAEFVLLPGTLLGEFHDSFRYNPGQPRVPAGSASGGQWAPDSSLPPSQGAAAPISREISARDIHGLPPGDDPAITSTSPVNDTPNLLPNQGGAAPAHREVSLRDLHGLGRRAKPITAGPEHLEGKVADLYGTEDVDRIFGAAPIAPIPFPSASRRKGEQLVDPAIVAAALSGETRLREIDPRVLHAIQPNVTRPGVNYYLSDAYRETGATYADQHVEANKAPIAYRHPRSDQWLILSGHHRATAALLKGEMLDAIVIPNRTTVVDREFAVAADGTVDAMGYRDVTPLIAVDEDADDAVIVDRFAVELVRAGSRVVVGSDADAVELLGLLGADREYAERLATWAH